jgi:hypothetical protein
MDTNCGLNDCHNVAGQFFGAMESNASTPNLSSLEASCPLNSPDSLAASARSWLTNTRRTLAWHFS